MSTQNTEYLVRYETGTATVWDANFDQAYGLFKQTLDRPVMAIDVIGPTEHQRGIVDHGS